jgi:hypothetical protein
MIDRTAQVPQHVEVGQGELVGCLQVVVQLAPQAGMGLQEAAPRMPSCRWQMPPLDRMVRPRATV